MTDRSSPILTELADIVGAPHLVLGADERAGYETDWTGRFRGATPAVVRPGTADEVVAIVDACVRHEVAIVPQGGNTGLVGGGVPRHGEIVVSLRRMDAIGPVDVVGRQVTAAAGATVAAVQQAAAAVGLRYAVDLAARDSATVGGTIATNAGGLHVLRYGGTREQLVGIDAVLGTGERITRLQGLVKDNTGYHLPSVLCGSEGTLGIVTSARLRLVPRYEQRVVALLGFDSMEDAVAAVAAVRATVDSLEAAEVFFDAGLRLVCDSFGLPPPFAQAWPVYVLLEAAAHGDPTAALADAVGGVSGVGDVAVASDEARQRALWRYREDHTLAVNTLGPPHKFDVTLPISGLAAFCAEIPSIVAAVVAEVRVWLFGHIADGNVHVNVTGAAPDDVRVDDAVLTHVASKGGSISAEHGIGTAKVPWLHLNRTAAELATMRAIKDALDPHRILNPHALLP